MGLKDFLKNRKKMQIYRQKLGKLNPARNPLKTKFEEQVRQAEKFKEKVKPEVKAVTIKKQQKPEEVRYSKAKTIRGLIQDLKKGLYPPREIVVGLIRKIKTRGVKSLTREEGTLWNMLLEDENAKKHIEKLWQEV